ncbi:polysaccharide transporter, PST family [Catalinimonas alkaloidigena]|uniref:Polysaccharide transporter, PST family n=2 Tax=Catalinimonas alkaloidigena TaxID=1075417 RepID=A0A1G9B3F7_9BACT|nr:polysaccharide transporter, PST family [Catalinimonas alkaloidigena]
MKGVFWSFVQSIGMRVITASVFFLLARLLAPEAFGLVAYAQVFINFAHIFANQGFGNAIIQRKELEKAHLDTAFWSHFAVSSIIALISVFSAHAIADIFEEPEIAPIIQVLAITFVVQSFISVQMSILLRKLDFKVLALRGMVVVCISSAIGVGMALAGYGVWSLIGQQLSAGIANAIILWGISDWRPSFNFSWRCFRELFSFSVNEMGSNLLRFLGGNTDRFLLGYSVGEEILGYYSLALKIINILLELTIETSRKVALPAFSKIQHQPERVLSYFYQATRYTNYLTIPVFAMLAFLAPQIMPLVFGPQWKDSAILLQILCVIGILQPIVQYNTTVMTALGKPRWQFYVSLVNMVGKTLLFLLVASYGVLYVCTAYDLVTLLTVPISLYCIYRLINLQIGTYLKQYVIPMGGIVLAILCAWSVEHWLGVLPIPLLDIAAKGLLIAGLYLGFVAIMAQDDRRWVMEIVTEFLEKKRKKKTA